MTIQEAISQTDALVPNTYSQTDKLHWLGLMDQRVAHTLHSGYAPCTPAALSYHSQTPLDTQLLVEPPYDELYLHYLALKIHFHNMDSEAYSQSSLLYNALWDSYRNYYNRTHTARAVQVNYL